MKRNGKTWGILAAIALLCAVLLCGCGDASDTNPYAAEWWEADSGYRITDMRVTVDASAGDRSMRITEEYDFTFDTRSHGFYRDIAINSGEKIRDVSVYDADDFGNEYDLSHEGGVLRIRVGDEDRYVRGDLHAAICYTMIVPEVSSAPDELALNVIGNGWTCEILKAEITVKLPAATVITPRYYYGEWGETRDPVAGGKIAAAPVSGRKEYSFTVEGLRAFEGFTVYYSMPAGTMQSKAEPLSWAIPFAAAIVVAAAILLKFLLGKSAPLSPVTQYYPPKHVGAGDKELPMDPVDMGYLIDNTCQGSDVTSLIFYFAGKGYLEIEAPEEGDKSDNFTLHKVCDLPEGLPKYQYTLFNKIFASGNTVTTASLTNKTYTAVQSAQTQIAAKYKGKLYDGKVSAAGWGVVVLTVLFALFAVWLPHMRVSVGYLWGFGALAVFPTVIAMLIGTYAVNNWLKLSPVARVALMVAMAVVAVGASCILLLVMHSDVLYIWERVSIVIAVACNSCIAPFIARRTEYYTEELNNVLGFKDFLQTAEKDRLETLLAENPQYYYDILPYANVLGVSDIWQEKFENLTLEPPAYYRGVSVFDIVLFNRLYRSSYRAYSAATVSRPSSSSHSGGGRGFGGGGHSGGGFGGGGGGRW